MLKNSGDLPELGDRELKSSSRQFNTPVAVAVQFSLDEIKQHFDADLKNVESLGNAIELCKNSQSNDQEQQEQVQTILRSQIVLAVAALDFYLHEIGKYCLLKMFRKEWDKSEQYSKIVISVDTFEHALDYDISVTVYDYFFNEIINNNNNNFSYKNFTSSEKIKQHLELTGLNFNKVMKQAFPKESPNNYRNVLHNLFQRRNQIAHQVDREHSNAEQAYLNEADAEKYVNDVKSIAEAIYKQAQEKDCKKK